MMYAFVSALHTYQNAGKFEMWVTGAQDSAVTVSTYWEKKYSLPETHAVRCPSSATATTLNIKHTDNDKVKITGAFTCTRGAAP